MAGGGIPEQAGGFGYLLPLEQRNESALAAAIGQVLQQYDEYSQAGESMSRQARERFSIPAMIRGHLELYQRVATSGQTPRRQRGIRAAASPLVRITLRRLCQA
jgi:glycosyltransferase involved in cell wall biosynthesis